MTPQFTQGQVVTHAETGQYGVVQQDYYGTGDVQVQWYDKNDPNAPRPYVQVLADGTRIEADGSVTTP